MTDWPKDYTRVPFPPLAGKERWEDAVADRAQIRDPDFHGGKREAIRMIVGYTEEPFTVPAFGRYTARKLVKRTPVPGDWIEFRDHKEANAFVQAWKRLGQ